MGGVGIRLFHGHQNCRDLPIKPGPPPLSIPPRSLMQSSFDNREIHVFRDSLDCLIIIDTRCRNSIGYIVGCNLEIYIYI